MTHSQEEILRETSPDTWDALIAYCEAAVQRQAATVVNYDLAKGPRGLLILKANLDGARLLIAALHRAKRDFKIEG